MAHSESTAACLISHVDTSTTLDERIPHPVPPPLAAVQTSAQDMSGRFKPACGASNGL